MTDQPKPRILIIENQHYQFSEMVPLLEDGFHLFPRTSKDFEKFMDMVRIFLNPRFAEHRRKHAGEQIVIAVRDFQPDLFIVDQILVGNYKGLGGTHLALELLKDFKKPIIFLSRTDQFQENIQKDLEKLSKEMIRFKWVSKGFSGSLILQPDYFSRNVKTAMEAFLLLPSYESDGALLSVASEFEHLLSRPVLERAWQKFFAANDWILWHVFPWPVELFEASFRLPLPVKSPSSAAGSTGTEYANEIDLVYIHRTTRHVALVELKQHRFDLMSRNEYRRGVHSPSHELTAAVQQAKWLRNEMTLRHRAIVEAREAMVDAGKLSKGEAHFEISNPKCVVVIGTLSGLTPTQKRSFDNYRNMEGNNVDVVAYSEILEKIRQLIAVRSDQ